MRGDNRGVVVCFMMMAVGAAWFTGILNRKMEERKND